MNIVHIAPNAPYNDYWGYQDNLLPKHQKKLGHTVTFIATNTIQKDGKVVLTDISDYVLSDGVRVIRLSLKKYLHRVITTQKSFLKVYPLLCDIKPDLIFIHGLIGKTVFEAIRYKKKNNPACVIVRDNHADYFNASVSRGIKGKLIRAWQRNYNRRSIKYIDRVYGVTPWRESFAQQYFGIPKNKTDVLIMGADDEKINLQEKSTICDKIRTKYGISKNDFLIVSGGKIDRAKNLHLLIRATKDMENVKLLLFGQVMDDIAQEFKEALLENPNAQSIGWIAADNVYDYFLAADLIVFPGSHSVLWEQACACKVPCLFKRFEGMDHVNNGGNADFIETTDVEHIKDKLEQIISSPAYAKMKEAALSEKTDIFLYSCIAKKSLECVPCKHQASE